MEINQNYLTFGKYLKTIRIEKQISLDEIFRQTRIGKENLQLIEDEDYDNLPAEVYVKGFLRSYSKVLGIDGDKVINLYFQGYNDYKEEMIKADEANVKWNERFLPKLIICLCGLLIIALIIFFANK